MANDERNREQRQPDVGAQPPLQIANPPKHNFFAHPEQRGNGAGRHLVTFAIASLGAMAVDVNEHNGLGHGFYLHLGFIEESRSELDPFGKPFPILHLELAKKG